MNSKDLPFIHYLVKKGGGLVPPSDVDDSYHSGKFYAPIERYAQALQETYQFHYSIYKGQGVFEEIDGKKAIYRGIAEKISIGQFTSRPGHFVLMFGHQKTFFNDQGELKIARLNIQWNELLSYQAKHTHPDHKLWFVDLEPADNTFDYLLETFGIAMIGCYQEGKVK